MTRPYCLQVYISDELGSLIRAVAKAKKISVSEWVRSVLADALTEDELVSRLDHSLERVARQSVFLMVGIDALLAGHPDHALRERTHQAYARKLREFGLAPASGEGGEA